MNNIKSNLSHPCDILSLHVTALSLSLRVGIGGALAMNIIIDTVLSHGCAPDIMNIITWMHFTFMDNPFVL